MNEALSFLAPIRVGLLGIGTVGRGTFEVLRRNQAEIQRRAGRAIRIDVVADLDQDRARAITGGAVQVVRDAREVIANPDIDVVVELIGGYGIARSLVLSAIAAGKHVVTANKALLAVHGTEIFAAARQQGVVVAFEAAVAGGIPSSRRCAKGSPPTVSNGSLASSMAPRISFCLKCAPKALTLLWRSKTLRLWDTRRPIRLLTLKASMLRTRPV